MWRPGEAARRREEERARRAEDARVAAERHEQSLGETRRQTSLTRIGVWVAVVGLVAAVGVALLLRDDPATPPAPPAAAPTTAGVTLSRMGDTDWLVPGRPDQLGTPPEFVPDAEGLESHCQEWQGWFARRKAAPAGGQVYIEVAAAVAAPVTIVDVDVRVLRKVREPATAVRCLLGGGGYQSAIGTVDLEARAPAVVVEDGSGRRFTVARGQDAFVVDPGRTEVIALGPKGTVGVTYEWTMTVTYIVDAKPVTETLGSAQDPLRHHHRAEGTNDPVYDWDPARKRWSAG